MLSGLLRTMLSVILVVGLMPGVALAAPQQPAPGARGVTAAATELAFQDGQTAWGASATLPDANLYAAVCAQLAEQGIAYDTDGSSTVTLDAEQASRFTMLDVSHQNIESLEGIQAFSQLASLKAFDNRITVGGMAAVGQLVRLTYLDLSRNQIKDPAGLADPAGPNAATAAQALSPLTRLAHLDLSHCALRYTSGLEALVNLRHLDLFDNLVHDFGGLGGLSQLAYLDLGENNETSAPFDERELSRLDGLSELSYFCFASNKTPGITGHLARMTKMRQLRLEGNSITDLSPLAGMGQMEKLVLCSNGISGVKALLGMTELTELYLNGNRLYAQQDGVDSTGLAGIFAADGGLVWKKLKKLDISDNWEWRFRGSGAGPRLFALDQAGQLELGYDYYRLYQTEDLAGGEYDSLVVRNTPHAQLPHVDASGVRYVTYEDFGAKADGSYDDYIALHNAHSYANKAGCEVRADGSRTYHLFKRYNTQWYDCATDVDWQGATFVIHDEDVDSMTGRNVPLLRLWPTASDNVEPGSWRSAHGDIVTMTATAGDPALHPDLAIDRGTTRLSGANFQSQLDALAALGYEQFYVQAFDADTKHYIRYGHDYAGSDQTDGFIVDAQGRLVANPDDPDANKPQWEFSQVTKLVITPIPKAQAHVRNATFIWNAPSSKSEVPYPHSKGMTYYYRNFQLRDCANVQVSNIKNYVGTPETNYDNGERSGSYYGNLQVSNAAKIVLEDDHFFARKFGYGGRSTYGLVISDTVDILVKGCTCNPESMLDGERWGVTGNNRDKDITYEGCTFNRIDAHEGYCNMKALDCTVGIHAFTLTGQGPLAIERCTVLSNYLVKLRQDYGSTWDTWDGHARIIDCTLEYHGQYSQGLISLMPAYDGGDSARVHDFGYPLRYPDVYVENLTVDERYFDPDVSVGRDSFLIVPNSTYNDAHLLPASYWPDWVTVNGITFENWENVRHGSEATGHAPYFRLTETTAGGIGQAAGGRPERSFWVGGVGVRADGADVTERLLGGEELSTAGSVVVTLDATGADSVENAYDVYRNGASIERDVPVEGPIERAFTVPGSYEVRIRSSEARGGWQAERTLRFAIEDADAPAVAEKLLYTRTVTLDGSQEPVAGSVTASSYLGASPEAIAGKEVVVRFTGAAPVMRLRQDGTTAQGGRGWLYYADLSPASVEERDGGWKLARFMGADIAEAWEDAKAYGGAYDNGEWQTGSIAVARGDFNRLLLVAPADGTCTFDRVTLVGGVAAAHPGADWVVAGKTADEIVRDMKAGWNLGNALDAYVGTDDGPQRELDRGDLETEVFWGNPKTTFETIRFVKEAGFNAVRVPVSWFQHVYDDGVDAGAPIRAAVHRYHVDEAWLARVREVVDYCYDQGMYVTLNTHHEKFWLETPTFGDEGARGAMLEELSAIWTQVAAEFSGYDQRLVFEGLNEPRATGEGVSYDREWGSSTPEDIETLNQLNQAFVDAVRGSDAGYNASRLLVVNTIGATTDPKMLSQLRLPQDGCLAVSMHPYQPWSFCASVAHDGEDYRWTTTTYDATVEVALDQVLYRAFAAFTSKGVPVVLDEFNAQDKGNTPERLKWMRHYVETARGWGMTCFLWDSGGVGVNAEGNRTAYVERAAEPARWVNDGQEQVARLLVQTAAGGGAAAWRSACAEQVPTGVGRGRQLNGATLDFAQKASIVYQVRWEDLREGGVDVEFTGAPPALYLSDANGFGSGGSGGAGDAGGWMGVAPSYVEWERGAAGGVAHWFSGQLSRLWKTGSVNGVANTEGTVSQLIVSGQPACTVSRVVLRGLEPAMDVSGGGYGDGSAAVRRLYTRPYTLTSPSEDGYSVRVDLSNPAIAWDEITDIAVRYSGDAPRLVITDDWERWTAFSAYLDVTVPDVEGQRVAFFRTSDFGELVKSATLPMARLLLAGGTEESPKECALVEMVALGGEVRPTPAMRSDEDVRDLDQLLYDLRSGYALKGHFDVQRNGSGKDGGYSDSEADLNVEACSTGRTYVTRKTIGDLAAAGITAVGIPVTWRQHLYETADNPYQIDRAWLERIHEVVDWCYEAGMSVVLDLHDDVWLAREGLNEPEEQARVELLAIWSQVAAEFSGYDQRLAFQALNEPAIGDAAFVNELNQAFVTLVRSLPGHDRRLLLVPTYGEPVGFDALSAFVLPDDPAGLTAASVHLYAPEGFTRFESWKTVEDAQASQDGNAYTPTRREALERAFEQLRVSLGGRGVRVAIGEFGSFYCGEGRQADRRAWMEDFVTQAKELGAPAFYTRLDRTVKETGAIAWSAYDESVQAWSSLSSGLFAAWREVLGDDDVTWGGRAEISPDELGDLASGEGIILGAPIVLDQSSTQAQPYSYRATLSRYDGTRQLWRSTDVGAIDADLQGREIAIAFTGDVPYLFPSTSDWKGWPKIEPRCVMGDPSSEEGAVAYWPYETIARVWCDLSYAPSGQGEARALTMEDLSFLSVATAGETEVRAAVLFGEAHRHDWGEWVVVKEPTFSEAGEKRRVCRTDPAHVQVRRVPALGHLDDGGEMTVGATKLLYTRPVTLTSPAPADDPTAFRTVYIDMTSDDVQGRDIAVRFTGASPTLALAYWWQVEADDANRTVIRSGLEGWTGVAPCQVAEVPDAVGQRVAFFRFEDMSAAWQGNAASWTRDEAIAGRDNRNTAYNQMMVCVSGGECTLVEVMALGLDEPAAVQMRAGDDVRTGAQILREMGAGYNFGGSLEANLAGAVSKKDGGWGRSDLSEEIHWKNPYITEEMVRAVKEQGFSTIRIPVTWYQHLLDRDGDGRAWEIDRAWLARVHEVVDYGLRNDLYVILNTHHENWIDRIDMDQPAARAEMVEQLEVVWTQIAREFDGYDQRLIFEGTNEPHATGAADDREWNKPNAGDLETVNALNDAFVRLIHSLPAHANRLLLCSTYGGHPELSTHIAGYVFPDDGSGLVAVSTHPYTPYSFTANRADGDNRFLGRHADELDRVMNGVRERFCDHGIPVVFDEFGCYYHEGFEDERLAWLSQYVTRATELGIPCVAWPMESAGAPNRFFDRASCTFSDVARAYMRTWLGILDGVEWGSRAHIAADEHADLAEGIELIASDTVLRFTGEAGSTEWMSKSCWYGLGQLEGGEVAVRFAGDVPRLALMDGAYGGWTAVEASIVDLETSTAYFPCESIRRLWCDEHDGDDLALFCFTTGGETTIARAAILPVAAGTGEDAGLAGVRKAVAAAEAYIGERALPAAAFKGALEHECADIQCYSVAPGSYYLLHQGSHFSYDREGGSVARVPLVQRRAVYDTLELANDRYVSDDAFLTRGRARRGDGGHAAYEKSAGALAFAEVGATAPIGMGDDVSFALDAALDGSRRYRLVAADGAIDIRQFGAVAQGQGEGDNAGGRRFEPAAETADARQLVHAFENTEFSTLLVPAGDWRLGAGVWAWRDGRAYCGFDATFYTDDSFSRQDALDALWMIRGEVVWGGARDEEGRPVDVYGTVDGVTLSGIRLERRTSPGHAAEYGYGVFVRNARNVTVERCAVVDEAEEIVCLELYGNYEDVSLLDTFAKGAGGVEIRDLSDEGGCRRIVVRGCTLEMSACDEGLAIFAGNEEGLVDAGGAQYPVLANCLVEDLLVERNSFVMKKPAAGTRAVAITCGYQDSPVRDVRICDNDFDVYAEAYLIQFGFAERCAFTGNRVRLRSSVPGRLGSLVERSDHSRTGPTTDITVSGNVITCPDEDGGLVRLVDRELGEQLTFSGNTLTVAGPVDKLLDSPATFRDNVFNLHDVKSLYSNVREVSGNSYAIDRLDMLFEGNGVNAQADIAITGEKAAIGSMPAHLMGFYGTGELAPAFNGHGLTFAGCRYSIWDASYEWRRIAYDPVVDGRLELGIRDCYLPGFDAAPYNSIDWNEAADGSEKIALSAGFLAREGAVRREVDGPTQVAVESDTAFAPAGAEPSGGGAAAREVVLSVSKTPLVADADAGSSAEQAAAAQEDYAARIGDARFTANEPVAAFSVNLELRAGGERIARLSEPAEVGWAIVSLPVGMRYSGRDAKVFQLHVARSGERQTIVHDAKVDAEGVIAVSVDRMSDFVVVMDTSYAVRFDSKGGSEVEPQSVVGGERLVRPADPTRAGYAFAGWLLDGEAYDFSAPVERDLRLEAAWSAAGGGTGVPGGGSDQPVGPGGPDGPGGSGSGSGDSGSGGSGSGGSGDPGAGGSDDPGAGGEDPDPVSPPAPVDPTPGDPGDKPAFVVMHRLYNPNSGEHFFTSNDEEREGLVALGWHDEGEGWAAPKLSEKPVWRLYNPNAGEHHYTDSADEQAWLVSLGWRDEGIGWYSAAADGGVALFRLYNPNQFANNHHYTADDGERDWLVSLGWRGEGIGWYGTLRAAG